MLPELSQYLLEMFNMVLWVGKINKDIIKENQDEFIQVLTKKTVHHVHELCRCVGDTKRLDQKLVEPRPRLEH